METPDKIYLAFDKGFVAQASNVKEDANGNSIFLPEYTPISYIRKYALLEWIEKELNECVGNSSWQRFNALQDVINKINSI